MAAKGPTLMTLPDNCLLQIVEEMDTGTRLNFQATNKRILCLIKTYARSIAKNRLASLAFFPLKPLENILTSTSHIRKALLQDQGFRKILEMEFRESRMDQFYNDMVDSFKTQPPQPDPVEERFLDKELMKCYLRLCDHIADLPANMPWQQGEFEMEPPAQAQHDRPAHRYNHVIQGAYLKQCFSFLDIVLFMKLTPTVFEYVTTMKDGNVFVDCYSGGWTPDRGLLPILAECLLRHGTWLLWACTRGNDLEREMAKKVVNGIILERDRIGDWENFPYPPIHQVLCDRLDELLPSEVQDNHDDHDDNM